MLGWDDSGPSAQNPPSGMSSILYIPYLNPFSLAIYKKKVSKSRSLEYSESIKFPIGIVEGSRISSNKISAISRTGPCLCIVFLLARVLTA